MSAVKVIVSDAAALDILEQSDWYHDQVGSRLARRWERAAASALIFLTTNPRSGSPCRFKAIELQDVRRAPITGFPKHLVLYRLTEEGLLVLRIVHGARDLEALLSETQ